jgi:hypothetical protein
MLALMFVACSGGPSSPSVARLSSQPSASASAGSGMLAFASSMRSHGVTNFPDPGGQLPAGLDPSSPQYVAAQRACQSLLPQGTGGGPPPADEEAALEYAACIRAHGFPNYPDPSFSRDGKHGIYEIVPPYADSPTFVAADRACANWQPLGGRGTPHARGGGGSP